MDVYILINSRAIGEHCRKINHHFNTEEIAVLIYRCKKISVDEKIKLYNELITDYPDMPMREHLHYGPFINIKEAIRDEITRLKKLKERLEKQEESIYIYRPLYLSTSKYEDFVTTKHIQKSYKEILKTVQNEINEYNDISMFEVIKKVFTGEQDIFADYKVDQVNKIPVLINIYEKEEGWEGFATIFINIPTPFKKGDILVSCSETPFRAGLLPAGGRNKNVFVLQGLLTWQDNFEQKLLHNYDESDMLGWGYYINDYNEIENDYQHEYDSFEYYEGELEGMNRILLAIKNLNDGKIELSEFMKAYELMKQEFLLQSLDGISDDGKRLLGLSDKDIEKINTFNHKDRLQDIEGLSLKKYDDEVNIEDITIKRIIKVSKEKENKEVSYEQAYNLVKNFQYRLRALYTVLYNLKQKVDEDNEKIIVKISRGEDLPVITKPLFKTILDGEKDNFMLVATDGVESEKVVIYCNKTYVDKLEQTLNELCSEWKEAITIEAENILCSNCNSFVEENDKYCSNCGNKLGGE